MSELGTRLKLLRNTLGLKQYEMAKKMGLGRVQFSHYETGRIAAPGPPFLGALVKAFGVNLNWLLTGEGSMFMVDVPDPSRSGGVAETRAAYNPEPDGGFIHLPLLTEAGAATSGRTDANVDGAELFAFRSDFIRRIAGGTSPDTIKYMFLVRIKGCSMSPTLLDNEIILVNSHPDHFKNGGIYLVRDLLDQSTLAKRIYKLNETLILHSDNLNYPDKEIQLTHSLTMDSIIIGRIAWGGRHYV